MLSGNALFGEAASSGGYRRVYDRRRSSLLLMVDGEHILPLGTSQDHKLVKW